MLEETNKKSSDLVKEIADDLDIPALHDTLADFYVLKEDPEVKRKGFDDEAERGLFRTYHVLVHLTDYNIPTTIKEQIGKCGVLGFCEGDVGKIMVCRFASRWISADLANTHMWQAALLIIHKHCLFLSVDFTVHLFLQNPKRKPKKKPTLKFIRHGISARNVPEVWRSVTRTWMRSRS